LIEHVANHDHSTLRPLPHAAEIRVIELGLRAIAEFECAKQGRHGIAATPWRRAKSSTILRPSG